MSKMETLSVKVGSGAHAVLIGSGHPIVVQTMCNTSTSDVAATVRQCITLSRKGAELIRITVPTLQDVENLRQIRDMLHEKGVFRPLVADVHFSSDIAMALPGIADKIRINPGNFHPVHEKARERFAVLMEKCKVYGTAIRIGINHGSLGSYITEKYGNTPEAMALAAMEWLEMAIEADFQDKVVISLKASNTVVMVEAYRALARLMRKRGVVVPLHVGVTEAGNGDAGRIKSAVAIATLLEEGIGNTVRVSLTEPPENELSTAYYLAERYGLAHTGSIPCQLTERERYILDAACAYGPKLLRGEIEDFACDDATLHDEILQACRKRFYRPEYIACPGCGRTMYDLQGTFERVKAATAGFSNVVIAVMGCIVNGPGEMADADYGYVGEGRGLVTLYRGRTPVLRHIPEAEAVEKLVELIKEFSA